MRFAAKGLRAQRQHDSELCLKNPWFPFCRHASEATSHPLCGWLEFHCLRQCEKADALLCLDGDLAVSPGLAKKKDRTVGRPPQTVFTRTNACFECIAKDIFAETKRFRLSK
jgi:hypothetical protein